MSCQLSFFSDLAAFIIIRKYSPVLDNVVKCYSTEAHPSLTESNHQFYSCPPEGGLLFADWAKGYFIPLILSL